MMFKKTGTVLLLIVALIGCVSRYQIERQYTTCLRRMPQINKVETGRVIEKGSFSATAGALYALTVPDAMTATDSSFDSRSTIFGDELAVTTSSLVHYYESRYTASGEGSYGFTDEISGGISLDVSGGHLDGAPADGNREIRNTNFEGSIFGKFAKKFGRIGIALKPEVLLAHVYGERQFRESGRDGFEITATETINRYIAAIRSSSVLRYEVTGVFVPYVGFQIKSQQLLNANNAFDHEVCYGAYGGVELQWRSFAFGPFFVFPLGAATTHYTSPAGAGMNVTVILKP